jgi:hypothetical protein
MAETASTRRVESFIVLFLPLEPVRGLFGLDRRSYGRTARDVSGILGVYFRGGVKLAGAV